MAASISDLELALELMRKKRWLEARSALEPVLGADAALHSLSAECSVFAHEDLVAEPRFREALRLDGTYGPALLGLGRLLARRGPARQREASAALQAASYLSGLSQAETSAATWEAAEAAVRAGDLRTALSLPITGPEAEALLIVLSSEQQRARLETLADQSIVIARLALGRSFRGASQLEKAAANACCLHDPVWASLDDKLGLHRAIQRHPEFFAGALIPETFELPLERAALDLADGVEAAGLADLADVSKAAADVIEAGPSWVQKDANGYGGGGISFHATAEQIPNTASLVQRYVKPPLLVLGRRCSLRVYIVIRDNRTFLASRGLVRFAADHYSNNDEFSHLTNAAQRVLAKEQDGLHDRELSWLESVDPGRFQRTTWPQVIAASKGIAALASSSTAAFTTWPQVVAASKGIAALSPTASYPKVLGLDFAVDADGGAWLLELNRTPGLAPRDRHDAPVKEAVADAAFGGENTHLELLNIDSPD